MWRFYSPRRISLLEGVWAALSVAVAHTLTRRLLPMALLTGALVSLWPKLEAALHMQPQFQRLMHLYYRLFESVYRFRYRHEREEFEQHREEFIERYGFSLEEDVAVELVTLERVIPVVQTQSIDGGALTVLSIDAYAEGSEVRLRLHLNEERESSVIPFGQDFPPMPELTLIVRDDRGHRWIAMPGSGGGGGTSWQWDFRAHQPIDPEARELVLEVPEITWRKHGPKRARADSVERIQAGPWTFRVSL